MKFILLLSTLISFGASACRVPTVLDSDYLKDGEVIFDGHITALESREMEQCLLENKKNGVKKDSELNCSLRLPGYELTVVISNYYKGKGEQKRTIYVRTCGVDMPRLNSKVIVSLEKEKTWYITAENEDYNNVEAALTSSSTRKITR